jgi:glycerophosphoryl diester phosphodiesterase
MSITRRELGFLAAAAGVTTALPAASQDLAPPAIIAEGGAAEERIEDTRSAFDLAINEGCDFIQVTLVPSKEGELFARRDPELSLSTNVASLPNYASRKTTKTIGGQSVAGWFAEDFTADELSALMCREPRPKLKPQNVKLNDKEPVLTLSQVLQIARNGCVRTARTIGVCARVIQTRRFNDLGVDVVERLANELSTEGYVSAAAAVWVQSSETDALQAFGRLSQVRRMLLIDAPGPDGAPLHVTSVDGLREAAGYAEAIAPDQDLLIDPTAAVFPAPTTLALDAHNAGLQVFSRTARAQNAFLPPQLRRGNPKSASFAGERGDLPKLLLALFSDRLDGVATDAPRDAASARRSAMEALAHGKHPNG